MLAGGDAQQLRRRDAQPVGSASHPEELEGQAPQDLRERQRQDAEEDAGVAHADVAEEGGHEQRRGDGPEQEQLHRLHVQVLDHECHGVGADAEVRRVAEGKQPRVTEEEVEAEAGDGKNQPVRELNGPDRRQR